MSWKKKKITSTLYRSTILIKRIGHGFPSGIFVVKAELKNIASLEP